VEIIPQLVIEEQLKPVFAPKLVEEEKLQPMSMEKSLSKNSLKRTCLFYYSSTPKIKNKNHDEA